MSKILSDLFATDVPKFVLAMLIPLIFLIIMLKNKESKYILSCFCWGVFSVILAFILNELFGKQEYERITDDVAPIVEETLKALPLLFLYRKDKKLLIYCAMASGVGFSIQETLFYFSSLSSSQELSSFVPVFVRTTTTCLMHGMTTAIIGYGLAITVRFKTITIPLALGLLALSATIHSIFNVLIGTKLIVIALIMPMVLYLLGLVLLYEDNQTIIQN